MGATPSVQREGKSPEDAPEDNSAPLSEAPDGENVDAKDGTRGGGKNRTEGPFRMGWRTGPGPEGCCVGIGPEKEN
ncbi:hypothetical protein DNTS_023966 [Danionella cerebrum]|uniref:Uncharacterized protein n=1 Tax=Danionella cerebrum TaxID=2873325 RepID=A0A553MV68_9TELE|nr:hypothetical protein DNTS_023966 [Danionella translucida]